VKFEARTKELVETFPDLAGLVEPLLVVRQVLREQLGILRRRLLAIVRNDDVCRRLMTIPGVGPVVALTYRATVDVPIRFRKSKSVGAVFGLTCAKYQSGANRPNRRDIAVRRRDGANNALRSSPDPIGALDKMVLAQTWAMQIARRRGMKRAIVALARRLAVIMHASMDRPRVAREFERNGHFGPR
jgi:transposase